MERKGFFNIKSGSVLRGEGCGRIFGIMWGVNNKEDFSCDRLSDEKFNAERNSEISWPFEEEVSDREKRNVTAADPGADNSEENRHHKDSAEDIDSDVWIEAVVFVDNFRGKPLSRLVGKQNESYDSEPDKRDNVKNVEPYREVEADFKAGYKWSDDVDGNDRNDSHKQSEFFFWARKFHKKVHKNNLLKVESEHKKAAWNRKISRWTIIRVKNTEIIVT